MTDSRPILQSRNTFNSQIDLTNMQYTNARFSSMDDSQPPPAYQVHAVPMNYQPPAAYEEFEYHDQYRSPRVRDSYGSEYYMLYAPRSPIEPNRSERDEISGPRSRWFNWNTWDLTIFSYCVWTSPATNCSWANCGGCDFSSVDCGGCDCSSVDCGGCSGMDCGNCNC